jgi:hypothetical protein
MNKIVCFTIKFNNPQITVWRGQHQEKTMKRIALLVILLAASIAVAKDHSSEYQEGTVSLERVS